jgi:DNA-binding LacI/PurR family transcriptional regulator
VKPCGFELANPGACYVNIAAVADLPAVNLRSIADLAGVSLMTVSRVLNDSPHVAPLTRERVRAAARSLNYQPDPHLARMMHQVRSRKASRERAVIAVVRDTPPQPRLQDPAHQYVSLPDIARRAAQQGFRAEEFWLGNGGVHARNLGRILQARGIEGMIVSPHSSRTWCAELDYSPFAAATFGYGLQQPSLHRASTNMVLGIGLATETLRLRGYRRIGLAVTQWVNERSQNTYSGAMLHFQQSLPARNRVPLLLFPGNDLGECAGVFAKWMKQHRPDALISLDTFVPQWLARSGLRIPEDLGFVVHDWTESMRGFAGIDHRRGHVAAAAVDMVATQLLHNERGIPEVPRQTLIPPVWVEGDSVRPAPPLPSSIAHG